MSVRYCVQAGVARVCDRAWANDGGGSEIATAMTLVNVPLAFRRLVPKYSRKLDCCSEVSGSPEGLY